MTFRSFLILLCGSTLAGPVMAQSKLDAPAAPTAPGSAMYTLADLYNRLVDGTAGTVRAGGFTEPAAGPTVAGTMYTLNQIMGKMPTVDANGAMEAEVLSGKTFWGLTSGAWGVKTGTVTAGANVTGSDGVLNIPIPNGLYSGGKTCTAQDANLLNSNIKTGVTIFGVAGSYTCTNPTGDATAGDVLTGKTFSNASDTGLSGAMPDKEGDNASTGQSYADSLVKLTAPTGFYDGGDTVTATEAQVAALESNLSADNIKSGVNIFGVTGTYTSTGPTFSAPFPVAKTGQTTSYATGDDGDLEKGVAWPSPRFTDNSNNTVTDNLTGLVWLKDANCAGALMTWSDALTWVATLKGDNTMCINTKLNDGSLAGQWRLPTIKELSSLVNAEVRNPALPAGHPFFGVQNNLYWSSTTYVPDPNYAWRVDLGTSSVFTRGKPQPIYVWPVRGGQ